MRILVAEDDPRVARFILRGLREEQYTVDVANNGEHALELAQTNDYDLLIFDVVMPKKTGVEVIKVLRQEKVKTPILLLTAKRATEDKVTGLDAGADDYLPKPFDFDELLARVRALLRRRGELVPSDLKVGDLQMDVRRQEITRGGKTIALTSREYALLEYFLRHKNQVVTRTLLAEHVWEHDFDPFSNVINVSVARLREKIDDDFAVKLLHTVRGRGYILRDPDQE